MGCASSKQNRCRHCNKPYSSPVPRSYSMHVHHPPQSEGESYHVVALTSTTLGSLKLDSPLTHKFSNGKVGHCADGYNFPNGNSLETQTEEFSMGLIEAKTWSNMIEQKIPKKAVVPKTPIRTPPGEPETIINTWELMEGLEDSSPFRSPMNHFRSFSFDQPSPSPIIDHHKSSKPMWLQMTEDESNLKSPSGIITDFDPDVISSFRKSLQELSPDSPFHLKQSIDKKERVVFYFTSLRGVRKTYEDCCHVRLILKGLGVRVDERDVSMHSGFKEELKELLGDGFIGLGLPKVFVGRDYIGGAEEIQRLHEDGKLEKLLNCCEKVEDDGGNGDAGRVCEACGDIRFVPCETCSGSCKIYYEVEQEEEEEEDDGELGDFGFQRCPDCNENGLIRCPLCCS